MYLYLNAVDTNAYNKSFCFSLQVAGKRDPEQEVEAQQWIEAVTGEKFPAGNYYLQQNGHR